MQRMKQQTFLRLAKRELGISYHQLANEIGVSPRTMEKWSLSDRSSDHREMPLIATKFISKLLEDLKRARLLAGDRRTAEIVDALVSHVDTEKLQDALRTFETLQQSSSVFVPMTVVRGKPRYFKTVSDKNAWSEKEELANARRANQARASAR